MRLELQRSNVSWEQFEEKKQPWVKLY